VPTDPTPAAPLTPEREREIRARVDGFPRPGCIRPSFNRGQILSLLAALDAARAERDILHTEVKRLASINASLVGCVEMFQENDDA
jgi:hypothetical protein